MSAARRLSILIVLVAAAWGAQADESFRCGKWIVTSEMTLGELTAKCGEPASRTTRTEDVHVRNRNNGLLLKTGQTTIETLTWDRGPRAAAMVVTVVDGTIKSIERKR